jgi:glycosyltransferase involved in cell wall biosynthesis
MTVLVYRRNLLAYSETFILEQSSHLRRYRSFFAGRSRIPGLALPDDRVALSKKEAPLVELSGRWPALVKRLRGEDVKLIHAHFEGGGIAMFPLANRLGVPLVTTGHGWDVTAGDSARWPNPALRWFYRQRRRALQREGRLFIAVSEHIRKKMLDLGYPAERTIVHYIGVDCDRFSPDESVAREPVVLFVGRLVEKKGCAHLIKAMAGLRTRLVIIGDGPLRPELEAMAPRAEFLGVQPGDVVRAWMNRARVLCVPTVRAANGDMDGCPIVFFEAQAMGLPVVAFASGGTPEAVVDGETGLLATEGDTTGLAERLARLLDSESDWERMSALARTRVRRDFDIVKQCEKLEAIYDALA